MPQQQHTGQAPEELLQGRFKVLEAIASPTVWGATWRVADVECANSEYLLQQLNVPPMRSGGEERLQALERAVENLRANPHPSRAGIVEFTSEPHRLWMLCTPPDGISIAARVSRHLGETSADRQIEIALNLANAIKLLLDLDQKQAVAGLESGNVYLSSDGAVTLTDFGLSLFLRPNLMNYHRSAEVGAMDVPALKKFGSLLFAALSGGMYEEGDSLQGKGLSTPVESLLGRTLTGYRRDNIRTFNELLTELRLMRLKTGSTPSVDSPSFWLSEGATAEVTDARPVERPHEAPSPRQPPSAWAAETVEALRSGEKSNRTTVEAGTLLKGRYRVASILGNPTAWGGVFSVTLEGGENPIEYIARQVRVPPLRQGLEERLRQIATVVEEWQANPHHSRVHIVDFFLEDRALWLVMERAPGIDIETFISARRITEKSAWRATIASSIGTALQQLAALPHNRQMVAHLSPKDILMMPDGSITIVNLCLGRFLKPTAAVDLDDAGVQIAGLKRFGELLYSLLTGEAFNTGGVIIDSALPEDLGYLVLRALGRNHLDPYPDLTRLVTDLTLYRGMVESELARVVNWDDIDLEPVKPIPWTQRYLPPFLYRWTVAVARWGEDNPKIVLAAELTLVAAFLCTLLVLFLQRFNGPRFAPLIGSAIFVAETDGRVEVVDSSEIRTIGSVDIGGPATSVLYGRRWQCAYFAVPSEKALVSLDLANKEVDRRLLHDVECPQQLFMAPGESLAIGLGSSEELMTIELKTMRIKRSFELPQKAGELVYVPSVNAVAYAATQPDRVVLYSPSLRRILATRTVQAPIRRLRIDPEGRSLWVLTSDTTGSLQVLDAVDLRLMGTLHLPARPVDVAYGVDAYVLLEQGGKVAVVHRPSYKIESRLLAGPPEADRVLFVAPRQLWFLDSTKEMTMMSLDQDSLLRKVTLQAPALNFAVGQ